MAARFRRLLLLMVCLGGVLLLLSPAFALAQKSTDLMLNFIRGGYYETITAGEQSTFLLEARNNGTENIDNIVFSATIPADWTVTFQPQRITSLSPGNFETVNVTFGTLESTAPDTYQILIRADSDTIHQNINSTVNVESPKGFWWIIGGIVLAIVIAGFIFVFFKYGRK